jgi:hypothetical protein
MLEKLVPDAIHSAARLVDTTFKEVWSRLDAASEKPRPSEYLGQQAIRAIQGREDSS